MDHIKYCIIAIFITLSIVLTEGFSVQEAMNQINQEDKSICADDLFCAYTHKCVRENIQTPEVERNTMWLSWAVFVSLEFIGNKVVIE